MNISYQSCKSLFEAFCVISLLNVVCNKYKLHALYSETRIVVDLNKLHLLKHEALFVLDVYRRREGAYGLITLLVCMFTNLVVIRFIQ
jgi:hypothetical protein